ncbi:hypothetical protein Fmac_031448 [Flemingia macrophylla]|uniref:Zinc finger PHD-type domain-containing protein n=1 Tax=Flemingia macrophylla TaxID=520843 RepID=A0ABD1L246_9FABA
MSAYSDCRLFGISLPSSPIASEPLGHTHMLSVISRVSNDDKISLRDIARERVDIISEKMHNLPDEFLQELKNGLRVILHGANGSQHRDEVFILKKLVQNRSDLTANTLIEAHRVQLEILVAINTGIQGFLHPSISLSRTTLIEIFVYKSCINIPCLHQLRADNCIFEKCVNGYGFCYICMCMICSKFELERNTCGWIKCDFCYHWSHTDCAILEELVCMGVCTKKGAGPSEMVFRCQSCNSTSELLGWVEEAFQLFAKSWDGKALIRELDIVSRIFRGSTDPKGRILFRKCNDLKQKLKSAKVEYEAAYREILKVFQDADGYAQLVLGSCATEGLLFSRSSSLSLSALFNFPNLRLRLPLSIYFIRFLQLGTHASPKSRHDCGLFGISLLSSPIAAVSRSEVASEPLGHTHMLPVIPRVSNADKISIRDIARERVGIISEKMLHLPDKFLQELKNGLRVILAGANGSQNRDEFFILKKLVQNRSDLTADTLIGTHRVQLEILVAINTGIQGFLHPSISLSRTTLIEIFVYKRCINIPCLHQLPVDDCTCEKCVNGNGFCSICMCMICSKFEFEINTCGWIECEFCCHWSHIDCAILEQLVCMGVYTKKGAGPSEMVLRCKSCNRTSELLGWVKNTFKSCAKSWDGEALIRELDVVSRIFRGSTDPKWRKIFWKCDDLKEKLKSGKVEYEAAYREIMTVFQVLTSETFSGGEGSEGLQEQQIQMQEWFPNQSCATRGLVFARNDEGLHEGSNNEMQNHKNESLYKQFQGHMNDERLYEGSSSEMQNRENEKLHKRFRGKQKICDSACSWSSLSLSSDSDTKITLSNSHDFSGPS